MDRSWHSKDSDLNCCSTQEKKKKNTHFIRKTLRVLWLSLWGALKSSVENAQLNVSLSDRVPTFKKIAIQKKKSASPLPDNIYISPASLSMCNSGTRGKANLISQIGVSQLCRAKYHCDLLSCFSIYIYI